MPKEDSFRIVAVLRALSDRTRLRLLNLLSNQKVCVCYLVEALKISQPKVSRHLGYLRKAGLVIARRQGKWMHYRMAAQPDAAVARLLLAVQESISSDKQVQHDLSRFTRACCEPQRFARLQGAPLPASVSGLRPTEQPSAEAT